MRTICLLRSALKARRPDRQGPVLPTAKFSPSSSGSSRPTRQPRIRLLLRCPDYKSFSLPSFFLGPSFPHSQHFFYWHETADQFLNIKQVTVCIVYVKEESNYLKFFLLNTFFVIFSYLVFFNSNSITGFFLHSLTYSIVASYACTATTAAWVLDCFGTNPLLHSIRWY